MRFRSSTLGYSGFYGVGWYGRAGLGRRGRGVIGGSSEEKKGSDRVVGMEVI